MVRHREFGPQRFPVHVATGFRFRHNPIDARMGIAMLVEPGQTAYDLRFRLFGTPVRVHPFFWLFSAILGWRVVDEQDGLLRLVIWIICCFLSVLLHEFGHIWIGALFGSRDSYIVLYSFGGLAVGSRDLVRRWQRIAV